MRYIFITWFDEVKSLRSADRTRVCSERQRKERKKYALDTLRSFNKQLYIVCFSYKRFDSNTDPIMSQIIPPILPFIRRYKQAVIRSIQLNPNF